MTAPPESTPAELALKAPGDSTAELLISRLLRYGVVTSVSVIVTGMSLSFLHHPDYLGSVAATARLSGSGDELHTLNGVWAGILAARGQAVVMVGLLLLISVPVTRVFLSMLIFGYRRDRVFLAITSVVSALLVLSFFLGGLSE